MYHNMFPPEIMAMQEEIQMHPQLMMKLLQLPKDSAIEEKIGEIAASVGIVLDGYYGEEEILELCTEITKRLRDSRVQLILAVSNSRNDP